MRLATDRLLRKDDGRVLTVSTLASLAAKWLLPRIASFQEKHNTIDVRITTSSDLVDFRRDEIDAALETCRRGIDFADALHLAASKSCSELLTFDDRSYARRAAKLGLKPPVRVPAG